MDSNRSTSNRNDSRNVDWSRYGLGAEGATRARAQSGGFVDLGNEYDYGAGGHQASGADELFAEEQVKYVSINFFTLSFFYFLF